MYVAPTSVNEPLLRSLALGARATGAKVLVATGAHDVHDLADSQVHVNGVLPKHLVMPRVTAAVIMGGQGSVQTAMASGTPFVGLPRHGEQELTVAVAERLGMAHEARRREDPGFDGRASAAVRRSGGVSARRVADVYEAADGAGQAADPILKWLGGPGRRKRARAQSSSSAAPAPR